MLTVTIFSPWRYTLLCILLLTSIAVKATTIEFHEETSYIPPQSYYTDAYGNSYPDSLHYVYVKYLVRSGCKLKTGLIHAGTEWRTIPAEGFSNKEFTGSGIIPIGSPSVDFYPKLGSVQKGTMWFGDKNTTLVCNDPSINVEEALSSAIQFISIGKEGEHKQYAYMHGMQPVKEVVQSCRYDVPSNVNITKPKSSEVILTNHSTKCTLPVKIDGQAINSSSSINIPLKHTQTGKTENIQFLGSDNAIHWDLNHWNAGKYNGVMEVKLQLP